MIFDDTIAAIATPVGEGGIGIIRISGPVALQIGRQILTNLKRESFSEISDRKVYYGLVVNPVTQQTLDEILFFYFKKPKSFTGEDTLEIQAHGGMFILAKILELVLQNGARMAEPGEFTQRAFINGKIDLVQAESIIDLIRAKTEKAHELALAQLTGKTTKALAQIEADLYQILINTEATLDFPEEVIPELKREEMLQQAALIHQNLSLILEGIDEGRKYRDGIKLVIVGRPNVGKSSLLNELLQEERAIVTPIPGTTRDIIEAPFQLRGVPIRLIDTAGLRETENVIERIGISKTEEYMAQADLILLMLDGSQSLTVEDRQVIDKLNGHQVLVIINKTDLPQVLKKESLTEFASDRIIELSLLTKKGLEAVEVKIIELVGLGNINLDDRPLLSRIRHKQALEQSLATLNEFISGLAEGRSEDLLAVDLRSCLNSLGTISGKNVSNEIIHGIFAQFCIGK
ncbi:MAG: tRNA uridine-5-carboxymethylaminomethyl(34) synthesis GTPase MnmE [Firmicutes bacterium]|nr:tRNA uridine-5-carboxymethylaminomethyl(34) synthesis GTPase MnmE [Bacillota bacterium]